MFIIYLFIYLSLYLFIYLFIYLLRKGRYEAYLQNLV